MRKRQTRFFVNIIGSYADNFQYKTMVVSSAAIISYRYD